MKLIYIAGKYTDETHSKIDDNIRLAEKAAVALWKKGWAVITPHLNTAHFERYEDDSLGYKTWINGYLEILRKCEAVFMLDGWEDSKGARKEQLLAFRICKEIYYQEDGYPDESSI